MQAVESPESLRLLMGVIWLVGGLGLASFAIWHLNARRVFVVRTAYVNLCAFGLFSPTVLYVISPTLKRGLDPSWVGIAWIGAGTMALAVFVSTYSARGSITLLGADRSSTRKAIEWALAELGLSSTPTNVELVFQLRDHELVIGASQKRLGVLGIVMQPRSDLLVQFASEVRTFFRTQPASFLRIWVVIALLGIVMALSGGIWTAYAMTG